MKKGLTSFLAAAVAMVVVGVAPYARAALTDNLELWYSFDGDTATSGGILDGSVNSRNGSPLDYTGAAASGVTFSTDVPAFFGTGLSLDLSATPNFVGSDTPGYTGVLGTTARSIAAWVKVTDSAVANPTIVEWGANANGQRYTFKVNTTAANGLLGGLRVEVQGGYIISGTRVINDGQWHHVAATFADDGTPDVEDVLLYVDGVLDNLSPPTTPNPEPINTVGLNNLTIGGSLVFTTSGSAGAAGRPFAGLIDEVGVWSRVLDANEIATMVPEPGTMSLALLGAGALLLRRRNG